VSEIGLQAINTVSSAQQFLMNTIGLGNTELPPGGIHGIEAKRALTEALGNVEKDGNQNLNASTFGSKDSWTSSRGMGKKCVSGPLNICPYLSDTEINVRKLSLGQKVKTSEPDLLDGSILAVKGKGCLDLSLASIQVVVNHDEPFRTQHACMRYSLSSRSKFDLRWGMQTG